MVNPKSLLEDYYSDPYHCGSCEAVTHIGECACRSTGCCLRVELRIDVNQSIGEAWFEARGCPICEGLISLLVETVEGWQAAEVAGWDQSNVAQRLDLTQIEDLGSECATLPLDTIQAALANAVCSEEADSDGPAFGGPSLGEES